MAEESFHETTVHQAIEHNLILIPKRAQQSACPLKVFVLNNQTIQDRRHPQGQPMQW